MKNLMHVRLTAAATALVIAAGAAALPAFAAGPDGTRGARSGREMSSQTMNSVWLLPDSDTYYISESDISWMDSEELMLARNEFYARRGRKFVTKSIRDYFNRQSWYDGWIEPDDFSTDVFNRYEQANVDFIVAYEKQRAQKRSQSRAKKSENRIAVSEASVEGYREIRERYENSFLEKWDEDEYDAHGVNRLVYNLDGPGDLGYMYRDLDGDGEDEFLIGPTDTRSFGEGAVFVIYTMEDGIPVEVASGDENSIYYICGDGSVCRELNYEDGSWEMDYYDLEDGSLSVTNVLVMDEEENSEEPWFTVSSEEFTEARTGSDNNAFESGGGYGDDEDSGDDEEPRDDEDSPDNEDSWENITGGDFGIELFVGDSGSARAADTDGMSSITYEEASLIRAAHPADTLELTPFE
ncbi:MAG: YARHG domain-containing protein [Eubacteriales bacterium]|nr:YARHG domain-containing protein [Eubacteriales bacterium]